MKLFAEIVKSETELSCPLLVKSPEIVRVKISARDAIAESELFVKEVAKIVRELFAKTAPEFVKAEALKVAESSAEIAPELVKSAVEVR